ncbi:uncharacterized protein LOC135942585 [Cloeon dipterum]|uniref:uncharacterized protein LOC135942585 n=1 Tax=Cloeon dipterum TaxID=197152 RepID=UPI00321FAB9C
MDVWSTHTRHESKHKDSVRSQSREIDARTVGMATNDGKEEDEITTKHWGEFDATPIVSNEKSTKSIIEDIFYLSKTPTQLSKENTQSCISKLVLLPDDPSTKTSTFDLDSEIDENLMSSVKLMEKLSNSGGSNIAGDAAFIIADFSENSELHPKYKRPPQSSGSAAITIDNPEDARLVLRKSISVILMHNEIFQCKRSVLECLVDVAGKFIKNLGVQLSLASSFGAASNAPILVEEAEIALHNVGIKGIADVVHYYRRNVIHRHLFVEASVNRLLSKDENSASAQEK